MGCGATVARATAGAQAAAPATPAVGRGNKINPSYLLRHWEWIDNWYSSNRSYVLDQFSGLSMPTCLFPLVLGAPVRIAYNQATNATNTAPRPIHKYIDPHECIMP